MASGRRIEIEGLLKRSNEALQAAHALHEEGYNLDAVSRAYYVMFYAAAAALLGVGIKSSKHSGVIALFGQHLAKTREVDPELHTTLQRAFKEREKADYDVFAKYSSEYVKRYLKEAETFLRAIRAFIERKGFLAS